jgi:Response regulator containing a CheY-like receiver domain and an HD-GYP domain
VLVAECEPVSRMLLASFMGEGYELTFAESSDEVLELASKTDRPDVLLLDSGFCEGDALGLLSRLKEGERSAKLPVIFSAPMLDQTSVERALALGASDFLSKPYLPGIVKLRIETQLELARSRAQLEALLAERTRELADSRLEVIRRLSRAAESRDNETGMHIVRMSKYAQMIAQSAGASVAKSELVLNAAPMHDIGKIGVPDSVLLKPGALDDLEWRSMREHCRIGANIIGKADSELARSAAAAALSHHERYDGSGYPSGLSGEAIPWIGRVVAIADVFDALTSVRPYKNAWPMDLALDLIRSEAGTHFDPELAAAFLDTRDEAAEIMALFPD